MAILALNSDRYAELLLAVPWADGIFNPINTRWSADEVVYALTDSGTSVLVVDDAFAGLVPALRDGYPALEAVVHAGDGPTPEGTVACEDLVAGSTPMPDARRRAADVRRGKGPQA